MSIKTNSQRKTLLFAAALCFCCVMQVVFVGYPMTQRALPIEPDDAYVYLLEPVRLLHPGGADNRAFRTLRKQFSELQATGKTDTMICDQAGKVFEVYHPLHSLALAVLHGAGLEWERVYNIAQIAGLILLLFAIGLWLRVLWGDMAAGVGLCILAVSVLPGQGYHAVVPSNIALAVMILGWVPLLQGKRIGIQTVVAGALMAAMIHPIGRAYAGASALLIFLVESPAPTLWKWGGALLCAMVIPVSAAAMRLLSSFPPGMDGELHGWHQMVVGVWGNLRDARLTLSRTPFVNRSLFVCMVIPVVSFFGSTPDRRRRLAAMALVIISLLIASMAVVVPGHTADVFTRVWVPAASFYAGAIGFFAVLVGQGVMRFVAGSRNIPLWKKIPEACRRGGIRMAAVMFGGLILLHVVCSLVVRGPDSMVTALRNMCHRGDRAYDKNLCKRLLAESNPGDLIVYGGGSLMQYALVHGLMDRGALLNLQMKKPIVALSSGGELGNIRFALFSNPAWLVATHTDGDAIRLNPASPVVLTGLAGQSSRHLEIHFQNTGPASVTVRLRIQEPEAPNDVVQAGQIVLPAGFNGWKELPWVPEMNVRSSELCFVSTGDGLKFYGLRAVAGQTSWWPWDSGIVIRIPSPLDGKPAIELRFDTHLWSDGLKAHPRILDDRYSSVLAEIP